MEQTLGEKRIRTDFNVTGDDVVATLKNESAKLIDLCKSIKNDTAAKYADMTQAQFQEVAGEQMRLIALAQTAYEEAAMWAVKAATANV